MKIKVLTSNVWADVFGNPVQPRDKDLASLFIERCPDFICLQEMHPNWHKSCLKPELFANGYKEVTPDLNGNPLNYTPLFYRSDRFGLERCGFFKYSGLNDYDSKSVTWGVFRAEDGTRVLGMATHLYWGGPGEPGNSARITDCRELAALTDEICAGEKLPVFCGGDYNCDIYSEPYKVLTEAGFISAATVSGKILKNICSMHSFPVYHPETKTYTGDLSDKTVEYSYDHFMIKNVKCVLTHEVITEDRAIQSTDHCPVVVKMYI